MKTATERAISTSVYRLREATNSRRDAPLRCMRRATSTELQEGCASGRVRPRSDVADSRAIWALPAGGRSHEGSGE